MIIIIIMRILVLIKACQPDEREREILASKAQIFEWHFGRQVTQTYMHTYKVNLNAICNSVIVEQSHLSALLLKLSLLTCKTFSFYIRLYLPFQKFLPSKFQANFCELNFRTITAAHRYKSRWMAAFSQFTQQVALSCGCGNSPPIYPFSSLENFAKLEQPNENSKCATGSYRRSQAGRLDSCQCDSKFKSNLLSSSMGSHLDISGTVGQTLSIQLARQLTKLTN